MLGETSTGIRTMKDIFFPSLSKLKFRQTLICVICPHLLGSKLLVTSCNHKSIREKLGSLQEVVC
jgi:hypothetical protein